MKARTLICYALFALVLTLTVQAVSSFNKGKSLNQITGSKKLTNDNEIETYTSFKANSTIKHALNRSQVDFPQKQAGGLIVDIPVIINVIYEPTQIGNQLPYPDDASVIAGINWINNLLSGGSACNGDPVSVETGIRLCVASRDIHGNSTTGIRRFPSMLANMDLCMDDLALKSIARQNDNLFPDTSYLNIYIVNEICASCKPGDCLAGGYAAYPSSHGTALDGIVLETNTWMNPNCNFRKVILHELGHYFNLRHTWEGNGCKNGDCMIDGDAVCDTPPDFDINIYPSNPCMQGMPVNSCTSDVNPMDPNNPFGTDQGDMTSNLMDYAPPGCIALFTDGQVNRMQLALQGPRSSLLRSKGCSLPCPVPITLNVQWPTSNLLFGNSIQIVNQIQPGVTYFWRWYGGTTISDNLFFPADSIGTFIICLDAIGSSQECVSSECDTIVVLCSGSIPEITLSDYQVEPFEDVFLTQTSTPLAGFTYTWFVNGIPYSNETSAIYTPNQQGSSVIWMEECSPGCCSESQHLYLSTGTCPSGKEANHWFFSRDNIHLDWNSGMPVERPPSSARSDEATTVGVDNMGSLLFYTDNEWVYNRNGLRMPNGRLKTSTSSSSTHCITIPMPGSDSLWYFFYPDPLVSFDPSRDTITSLYYGIIDLSLDGGLGNLIIKDQVLLLPSTEKVAAVKHCNDTDWWIVGHESDAAHGSNRFFAWLLTSAGLSVPVISSSGEPIAGISFTKAGEMNISSDGLHIAMSTGPELEFGTNPFCTIELFDFDPSTGSVSNNVLIGQFQYQTFGLGLGDTYGLEFSPSNDFLYVARSAWEKDSLLQYDIRSADANEIIESKVDIYQSSNPIDDNFGAMLTGPDQRIYIINFQNPYLNAINNPNLKGIPANFNSHGIDLQRGDCFVGLPTFPAGIYTPGKPFLKGPYTICDSIKEAKFYVSANCRYQDYEWKIFGTSEILRHQGDTVWVKPGSPGIERLVVNKFTACGMKTDTFQIQIASCKSNEMPCSVDFTWNEADTILCQGEDAWLHFNTEATSIRYKLASQSIEHSITSPVLFLSKPLQDDILTIYLSTLGGCDTTINVGIHVNPPLQVHIVSMDTVICHGERASISINHQPNYLIELFPADATWVITNPSWPLAIGPLTSDTTVYVRMRDIAMNCDSIYSWHVRVEDIEPISYDTIFYCFGDSVNVSGNWYKSDSTIIQNFPRQGCDSILQTEVIAFPRAIVQYEIHQPCIGATGGISIQMVAGYPPFQFLIDNNLPQSEPSFIGLNAGNYLITVIDGNGCRIDTLIELKQGTGVGKLSWDIIEPSCDLNNGVLRLKSEVSGILYSINGGAFLSDTVYQSLPEGEYQIVAFHPAGCKDTLEVALTQTGKPSIEELEISAAHCGQTDGSITVLSIEDGKGPYQVKLGDLPFDSTMKFSGLIAGSYILSVMDSNQCIIDTSVIINSNPGPIIENLSVTPALCGMPLGTISLLTEPLNGLTFQLENEVPIHNPYFSTLLPGLYLITVADSFFCKSQIEVIIPDSFSFDIIGINVDPTKCQQKNGSINISISGTTPSIIVQEIPGKIYTGIVDNLEAGLYHLNIRDDLDCTLDTTVEVSKICEIYLSNVFSPNGDDINDIFGIVNYMPFDLWELQVFDRSGNMVFKSNDPLTGWTGLFHGIMVQSGVYAWKLEYKLSNDPLAKFKKGDITLIR